MIEKIAIFVLVLLAPLFFYNLGGYSLVDFDEAWYGEISRRIIVSGNPLILTFNDKPYLDHPPLGFILMAISQLIFGSNEFGVRFPSALCGFGSLVLTYLVGRSLANNVVGLSSMLVMASSVWFILRSRQGDLDTILLFFYLLTIYFALQVKKNSNYIYALGASFALLLASKSIFGLTVIPTVIAIFFINKLKVDLKKVFISLFVFLIVSATWIIPNYFQYKQDFIYKMIWVGIKPEQQHAINFAELHRSLTFVYLHFGIRKWFYPAVLSFLIGLLFVLRKKNLLVIYAWILFPLFGFLTSSRVEIWHLIPIYPAISILISFCVYESLNLILAKNTAIYLTIAFFIIISSGLIFSFRNEIKLFDRERTPLASVSSAAKGRIEPLYISSDLSIPATPVFYAQKNVRVVRDENPPVNTIPELLDAGPKPFLLITQDWRLKADGVDVDRYQVLLKDNDYLLILVN